MIIQHNIMAMSAYRNYMGNTNALSKNLEKLSSGYRINRAGDDAAGLAISEKMRAQITGLDAAQKNVKDGISLVQTAEGALQEVQDMLNRMVYLASQSANGTYDNEVDRANLQKEVDALSTEIDRIADSSNFNGINLLDGSLGLNTDAISVSGADAVEYATSSIDISAQFDAATHGHDEEETSLQSVPSFTIDLSGLSVEHSGYTASATANLQISVGGENLEVELDGNDGNKSASEIAALAEADATNFLNYSKAGTATNDAVKIGDFVFDVEADGEKLKFTFAGMDDGGFKATTYDPADEDTFGAKDFETTDADTLNAALGSGVTISYTAAAGGTGGIATNANQHAVVDVKQAEAKEVGTLAGIDLKLNADMVAEGAQLTVDGNTFTFTYDAEKAAEGENMIDLSAYDVGSADAIHAAVDQLSNTGELQSASDSARKFQIGSAGSDVIRIDQKVASAGEKITKEDLQKLVTSSKVTAEAANVGTTIELDASKLVEGNTLTVDGKAFVFSAKPDEVEGAIGVDINNAVADLAAKLGAEFGEDNVSVADNKVTIRAAEADAAAPVVLGKGLVLQIGDTAENFNQLAVSVEDMHVEALGIGDINIGTQEGASVAIDKIKAAINSVSMTRGTLGATQNRLEHTSNNLAVMEENIQDAESSIRDTDIAEEMMAYTKNNILIQSAQAMLAQANTIPQGVLQLLG